MIQLDSEQKRVLKAVVGSGMGMVAGTLIYYACSGKLDSWKDSLAWLGVGLIVAVVMGVFYVLGSKIPKKDE